MKIQLRCIKCEEVSSAFVHIRDDGCYDVQCKNGHRLLATLQNPRFELLVDSGAMALRDDYFREAVVSFGVALEAFWGFYVRVTARRFGATNETITRLQKDLKLAERRIGAMHLAHLLLVGEPYDGDPDKRRTFRNNVVHNGMFPSRDEALNYGRYVYDTAWEGLDELRSKAGDLVDVEVAWGIADAHRKLTARASDTPRSTYGVATLINMAGMLGPRRSFDDALINWNFANVWDLNSAEEARQI